MGFHSSIGPRIALVMVRHRLPVFSLPSGYSSSWKAGESFPWVVEAGSGALLGSGH
jgi:hypothetical protein